MTPKFDYLISSVLSVAVHGAVAAGIYGSITGFAAPQIDFHSGNAGIDVAIIAPSEVAPTISKGQPAAQAAQLQTTRPELQIPSKLKPVALREKISNQSARAASIVKPRQEKIVAVDSTREPTESEAERSCQNLNSCATRASLGRAGDVRASGVGIVSAPKPPYPWEARRVGFEGQVVITVDITKAGAVRSAILSRSSGRDDCDKSALETIRERWRFSPARLDGEAIDWREKILVVYDLNN
jgi:protein TonB